MKIREESVMNQEIENRGCATEAFGRKWLTCRICGEHANNNIYKVLKLPTLKMGFAP